MFLNKFLIRLSAVGLIAVILPVVSGCGGGTESGDPLALVRVDGDGEGALNSENLVEEEVGQFFITHRDSDTSLSLFIRFNLIAIIAEEDKSTFEEVLKQRNTRLREAVITMIQGTETRRLTDPNWTFIKLELKGTVNRALKSRMVKDLVFSDFSLEKS